jgi:hypothetical protein
MFQSVTADEPVTVQNQDETVENIELLRCDGSEPPQPDEIVL